MKGGFRYRRSKKMKGRGLKSHSKTHTRKHAGKSPKRHSRRHSKRHSKRHYKRHSRKYSMSGGSLTTLDPAMFVEGENIILPNNQPTVGPNFNTSAGYGYNFSDPPLGGITPNTQCTDY